MIRYLVTTHGHLPGARLSRLGDWGNVPHASIEEAEEAARQDARGAPFRIARKAYEGLPSPPLFDEASRTVTGG